MRRRRTLLPAAGLVAAALAVAAVGWLALVAPQRARAHRLSGQIAAAQSQLLALEAERSGFAGVSAAELYQLARAMPVSDDVPGILLDLDRAAGAAGVQLVSVKPSPSTKLTDGSSALPISVVVAGRYAHVTGFLHRIRVQVRRRGGAVVASGRLYAVDRADLALGKGNAVTATLQLDAFDYGEPPAATATAAPAAAAPASGAEAAGATP